MLVLSFQRVEIRQGVAALYGARFALGPGFGEQLFGKQRFSATAMPKKGNVANS